MFEIATLTANNTVQLPAEIARRLIPSLLKRVEDAPEEEPISLDEINGIVHKVRSSVSDKVVSGR
ncbi:MAG: hypothetical protein KJZ86_05110 [Caldilineaceae bacterium]|nr:hypothetical protein [Caldilineaceae bacterium]HRJ44087.1 hypothetical protein [Caldilineaceae bacterium]